MRECIEFSESQNMNQIGATIQGESVQAKDISIDGLLLGYAYEQRKALLDTFVPQVGGRFIFNDEWEIAVVPRITPKIERKRHNPKFMLVMHAPYPYWRRRRETVVSLAGLTRAFRFPWNISVPYRFSTRTESFFANAYNGGNVPASFDVRFVAVTALSNPMITRVGTNEFLRIEKDLEAGETIDISTDSGLTVMSTVQGISTNAFGYLDLDSSLFKLEVGDNMLRYDADDNREGLECFVIMRDTISVCICV